MKREIGVSAILRACRRCVPGGHIELAIADGKTAKILAISRPVVSCSVEFGDLGVPYHVINIRQGTPAEEIESRLEQDAEEQRQEEIERRLEQDAEEQRQK